MSTTLATQRSRQLQPLFRPFRMLQQEFGDLFNRLSSDFDENWLMPEFTTPCDLSETADAFQVRKDVPGNKPEEITIQVTGGDTVNISGERKEEQEEKGKTYHRI